MRKVLVRGDDPISRMNERECESLMKKEVSAIRSGGLRFPKIK